MDIPAANFVSDLEDLLTTPGCNLRGIFPNGIPQVQGQNESVNVYEQICERFVGGGGGYCSLNETPPPPRPHVYVSEQYNL